MVGIHVQYTPRLYVHTQGREMRLLFCRAAGFDGYWQFSGRGLVAHSIRTIGDPHSLALTGG